MFVDTPRWQRQGEQTAHLFSSDIAALHALARQTGLGNDAFQAHAVIPHYQIHEALIPSAIGHGAVQITDNIERGHRLSQVARELSDASRAPAGSRRPSRANAIAAPQKTRTQPPVPSQMDLL